MVEGGSPVRVLVIVCYKLNVASWCFPCWVFVCSTVTRSGQALSATPLVLPALTNRLGAILAVTPGGSVA
jgi:hypothetical protein